MGNPATLQNANGLPLSSTKATTPATEFPTLSTVTTVLAANPNRIGAMISCHISNTKRGRFAFAAAGQTGAAVTTSAPLEAGSTLNIDPTYTGPVSMVSDDNATTIKVYVVEW